MRKLTLGLAATAALAIAGQAVAQQPIQRVEDPTPNKTFTGSYDCSYYTYDAEGNATKVEKTCTQSGYVAVYQDGVVACNGNPEHKRPDNSEPLAGYVWVGPNHKAKDPAGQTPGGEAGAGNNTSADDPATQGTDEAHGPCEDKPQR